MKLSAPAIIALACVDNLRHGTDLFGSKKPKNCSLICKVCSDRGVARLIIL